MKSNKLIKAFADFVGEKGFAIVNADEISQQPNEDYRVARQIFSHRRVLLPFMIAAASTLGDKKQSFEFSVPNAEDIGKLNNFLDGLKKLGYAAEFIKKEANTFSVRLSIDNKAGVRFFRSAWAEQCFRYAINRVVVDFCETRKSSLSFKVFQNVKLRRNGEDDLFTELDLVAQIGKRFYLFEIKSGPWVRILQWARREEALITENGPARQIVCTIYDNIPAKIFKPQLLMTIGGLSKSLKKLLVDDFPS